MMAHGTIKVGQQPPASCKLPTLRCRYGEIPFLENCAKGDLNIEHSSAREASGKVVPSL